jgi:hypothetical protein
LDAELAENSLFPRFSIRFLRQGADSPRLSLAGTVGASLSLSYFTLTDQTLTGAAMSTSIITTTTFTFATMIDIGVPPTVPALASEVEEIKIAECEWAAVPRCAWTARKHCGRNESCKTS